MKKSLHNLFVRVVAFIWKTSVELFRGKGLHRIQPIRTIYEWMVSVIGTYEMPEAVNVGGYKVYSTRLHKASLALWGNGNHESSFRLFAREIKHGATVIDVGANVGHYALHLAHAAGPDGKVFAFEPTPESVKFLNKNMAANNVRNVTVIAKAVGDHSGKTDLYLGHEPGGNQIFDVRKLIEALPNPNTNYKAMLENKKRFKDHEQTVSVDLVSLDDFFKDYGKPIDFVKIDVEGAEDSVLAGMKDILKKNPAIKILFEFTPALLALRGTDPKMLLEKLRGMGFSLYSLTMADAKSRKPASVSASVDEILALCKGNTSIDVFAKRA